MTQIGRIFVQKRVIGLWEKEIVKHSSFFATEFGFAHFVFIVGIFKKRKLLEVECGILEQSAARIV